MPDIYNMSDVFLSYSRKDTEFVHRLFDDFKSRGKEVWADFEDIPKAADWWQEIQAGINAADAFVFIISPDSVVSDVCRQEIEHAIAMNKRFLPVLYRDVVTPEAKAKMHPAISSHNWIYFREQDDYTTAFNTLFQSIETDLEHNRISTRLLVRAREWESKKREQSYLLRDKDLEQAETWLATSINKQPSPTDLHAEYINASRMVQAGKQRMLLTFVSAGFVVALLLAIFAIYQTIQAQEAQRAAEEAQRAAEASALRAQTLALSASANEALANGNLDLALILAQNAVETDPTLQQAALSLSDAAYASGTRELIPMRAVVTRVAYSHDGSIIVAGMSDGNICIYNTIDFEQIICLGNGTLPHEGEIYGLHISADSTHLLSSGEDFGLKLWDIDADSPTYGQIIEHRSIEELNRSAMDDSGSFALFGRNDGRMGRWDFESGLITIFPRAHTDEIMSITIEEGGLRALSGSLNGTIVLWDLVNNRLSGTYQPDGVKSIAHAVAFNPQGTLAVAGFQDTSLRAWNISTGQLVRTFQGHDSAVTSINFAASGRTMFTSSWDNSIIEWDITSGRIIRHFNGHTGGVNAIALSDDNQFMVSGSFDRSLRIWNTQPYTLQQSYLTDNRIRTSDYFAGLMITGHDNGTVNLLDTESGVLTSIEGQPSTRVAGTRFSPDGSEVAILHSECELFVHAIDGTLLLQVNYEFKTPCHRILYRPQFDELLLLADDGLHRINRADGSLIADVPYEGDTPPLYSSIAFLPDGETLVVGLNTQTQNLQEINVESGEIIRTFLGHTDGILAIDLNEDGSRMVSGSFDNEAIIWDLATGDVIDYFEGHSDRVTDVAFSPDGRYIASASNDRTVRLWDIESNFSIFTYTGHTDRVVRVHFSEDSQNIYSSSFDTRIIRWRVPQAIPDILNWITENRYIRTLTCTEQRLYLDSTLVCEEE